MTSTRVTTRRSRMNRVEDNHAVQIEAHPPDTADNTNRIDKTTNEAPSNAKSEPPNNDIAAAPSQSKPLGPTPPPHLPTATRIPLPAPYPSLLGMHSRPPTAVVGLPIVRPPYVAPNHVLQKTVEVIAAARKIQQEKLIQQQQQQQQQQYEQQQLEQAGGSSGGDKSIDNIDPGASATLSKQQQEAQQQLPGSVVQPPPTSIPASVLLPQFKRKADGTLVMPIQSRHHTSMQSPSTAHGIPSIRTTAQEPVLGIPVSQTTPSFPLPMTSRVQTPLLTSSLPAHYHASVMPMQRRNEMDNNRNASILLHEGGQEKEEVATSSLMERDAVLTLGTAGRLAHGDPMASLVQTQQKQQQFQSLHGIDTGNKTRNNDDDDDNNEYGYASDNDDNDDDGDDDDDLVFGGGSGGDMYGEESENSAEASESQNGKKARLVWTQELHNRFINALSRLGLKHAVPKNILILMDVGGMTRENVASHLQKYRLYLKKKGGYSDRDKIDVDVLQALHEQNVHYMASQQAVQYTHLVSRHHHHHNQQQQQYDHHHHHHHNQQQQQYDHHHHHHHNQQQQHQYAGIVVGGIGLGSNMSLLAPSTALPGAISHHIGVPQQQHQHSVSSSQYLIHEHYTAASASAAAAIPRHSVLPGAPLQASTVHDRATVPYHPGIPIVPGMNPSISIVPGLPVTEGIPPYGPSLVQSLPLRPPPIATATPSSAAGVIAIPVGEPVSPTVTAAVATGGHFNPQGWQYPPLPIPDNDEPALADPGLPALRSSGFDILTSGSGGVCGTMMIGVGEDRKGVGGEEPLAVKNVDGGGGGGGDGNCREDEGDSEEARRSSDSKKAESSDKKVDRGVGDNVNSSLVAVMNAEGSDKKSGVGDEVKVAVDDDDALVHAALLHAGLLQD